MAKAKPSPIPDSPDGSGGLRERRPRRTSNGDERSYRVPAAARALALLELLAAESAPIGVSAAARAIGIPKSSCFALLSTLEQAGYVRRSQGDEWALTLHIYHLGLRAARNTDIESAAEPVLNGLCAKTGLTTHLGLLDRNAIIYAMKVEPPGAMVKFDTYPGKRASLHLTAIGRAVASTMEDEAIAALLDGYDFSGGVNSKIRSPARFRHELRRVRELGYALEMEEETTGVACVAAPVRYPRPVGIGVTGLAPQIRERSVARASAEVVEAAASLSAILGEYDADS